MSFAVVGTDTDIGKTLVSALLCLRLRAHYWKPVATGASTSRDSLTVQVLAGASFTPESYFFDPPIAPHLAAQRVGVEIDTHALTRTYHTLPNNTVVEGIGGVLVPLTPHVLFADWLAQLDLPTIVVASTRLGTLNHTLLTLEALRARHIPIHGVILNGAPDDEVKNAIAECGRVQVLAHIPILETITPTTLAQIPLTL